MASSPEYLREIDAFIASENARNLFSIDFGTVNPFTEGASTASTSSLSISTTAGKVLNGVGSLKMSGTDNTGAGTQKSVIAEFFTGLRNSNKVRVSMRFMIDTAQADWHYLQWNIYRYKNGSPQDLVAHRFNCKLGVDPVYDVYTQAGVNETISGFGSDLFQATLFDVWHLWAIEIDFESEEVKHFQLDDTVITPSDADASNYYYSDLAVDQGIDMIGIYLSFGVDADNTAHDMYIDSMKITEL